MPIGQMTGKAFRQEVPIPRLSRAVPSLPLALARRAHYMRLTSHLLFEFLASLLLLLSAASLLAAAQPALESDRKGFTTPSEAESGPVGAKDGITVRVPSTRPASSLPKTSPLTQILSAVWADAVRR